MSQAKRDHSAFNQSAAVGRALARPKAAAPELLVTPNWTDLRVLESWDHKSTSGGDPYNGIGARAVAGRGLHK